MIFNLKDRFTILKQFDGEYNYFNSSSYGGLTIYRREHKYNDIILVSDIVDHDDNIILEHHEDGDILISYEDARIINANVISVCICKRNLNDLVCIREVSFALYDIYNKIFTSFKTQNAHFEKHWQFYKNKIIYHLCPYTILDRSENIISKRDLNWTLWESRYGQPRLSTNVFEIDSKYYMLFHSSVCYGQLYYKYYIGLLRVNEDLTPVGYYINPFMEANREYSDNSVLNSLWDWRKTELLNTVKYEVIFPMNVVITDKINIYAGMNDCSAVRIDIEIEEFIDKIKDEPAILL